MLVADLDEIKTAALDAAANVVSPRLKGYVAKRTRRGKAYSFPGGLCVSICMESSGRPDMCMRCWHRSPTDSDILQRLRMIENGIKLLPANLKKYFITYEISERMLRVGSQVIPGLVMEWLNGTTLSEYVDDESSHTGKELETLAERFKEMCCLMNSKQVVHGDLSGGNIMVMPDGSLKLIDYDSMYFSSMGRRAQGVAGDEAYQHPGRKTHPYAETYADFFSQHIIYVSLLMMSRDASLRPPHGDKGMVFSMTALRSAKLFAESEPYRKGKNMKSELISRELDIILRALQGPYSSVPPLESGVKETPKPAATSTVVWGRYCTACGTPFADRDSHEKKFRFCPACGEKRISYTVK